MSFEEPKAPIVRIRKKKTKKKSKENDIVHLPVRASRQTRYSSLVPPAYPQNKGRECCRRMFAACFKIPVCKVVCFRCILPKCYSGTGSDDEENDPEGRDEGYHSQNRRSSEVTPVPIALGAQGGSNEPQDVEMTEMKATETVVLIPPPRVAINDYRKDPCSSDQDQLEGATGDITYIEVESVSLHRDGSPPEEEDNESFTIPKYEPKNDSKPIPMQSNTLKLSGEEVSRTREVDTDYEIPIHLRFLDKEKPSQTKSQVSTGPNKADKTECTVDYEDSNNNNDVSATEHYVNEEVFMAHQSKSLSHGKQENSDPESTDYANILGVESNRPNEHTRNVNERSNDTSEDEQHDYLNLTSLEPTSETNTKNKDQKEFKIVGMVNTKSEDIIKLRKDLFSKYSSKKKDTTPSKVSREEPTLDSGLKTDDIDETNERIQVSDVTNLVENDIESDERNVSEKVLLPIRMSLKEQKTNGSSSEGEADDLVQEIVTDETTDQTKLI